MYHLFWIFIVYSFAGWILDCMYAAVKNRKFINRGVLGGPFCGIYGAAAILFIIFLPDLAEAPVFLFLGSAILYGACEWTSGKLLERIYHRKWWDYSGHKHHIDGYVSLYSAAFGGLLGVISVKWLNPLLLSAIGAIPSEFGRLFLTAVAVLLIIDFLCTYSFLLGLPQRFPAAEKIENRILKFSARLNEWIIEHSGKRLENAFPHAKRKSRQLSGQVFAEGCSAAKLFWLFVIGSFLGDLAETVFCRITMHTWMSRSSLVWGPFSIVWGLGIAGATWILYNYRDRSDGFLFWQGTILGGAFEYVCSVFTERIFGQVFWDYSGFRFNLGGRINLLYCFFWGIAAVIWLKFLYPFVSKRIEKIPLKAGKYLTIFLLIFMLADGLVSSAALTRYRERSQNIAAGNAAAEWLDMHYNDEKMARIYPSAKKTE